MSAPTYTRGDDPWAHISALEEWAEKAEAELEQARTRIVSLETYLDAASKGSAKAQLYRDALERIEDSEDEAWFLRKIARDSLAGKGQT